MWLLETAGDLGLMTLGVIFNPVWLYSIVEQKFQFNYKIPIFIKEKNIFFSEIGFVSNVCF